MLSSVMNTNGENSFVALIRDTIIWELENLQGLSGGLSKLIGMGRLIDLTPKKHELVDVGASTTNFEDPAAYPDLCHRAA
jgi:hypothetical protein